MELGIRQDDNGRTPVECITGDAPDVSKYNEYKKKMSDSLEKLETKWKMESAGIPDSAGTRCYGLTLSILENEDDKFLIELN